MSIGVTPGATVDIRVAGYSATSLRTILSMASERLLEYRATYVPDDEATLSLATQLSNIRDGVRG